MRQLQLPKMLFILLLALPMIAFCQDSNIELQINDLSAFNKPYQNWSTVADVSIDYSTGSVQTSSGSGVIYTNASKGQSQITTTESFGDFELEFDFMLGKEASSALLIHNQYRINLSDSWTSASSNQILGSIGSGTSLTGSVPSINAAKAPGLWQHAKIIFRAPQFNNDEKASNALLEELYLNDVLVQQQVGLQASEGSEQGPISFLCSSGQLALRNVKIKSIEPEDNIVRPMRRRFSWVVNPIIVEPEDGNYMLRSFLNFNGEKKTHVVSVGSPKDIHYSYDLKQGALLQVWNGPFVDATQMWWNRGEPQLAVPIGSVIALSGSPSFAVLAKNNTPWVDSIAFDDFKTLGYTLDKDRAPTFEYETGGYHVWDKISVTAESRELERQLQVKGVPDNLYFLLAKGASISMKDKGMYVINDKQYYLQIDKKLKPTIRSTAQGDELIIRVSENEPITYSLIW